MSGPHTMPLGDRAELEAAAAEVQRYPSDAMIRMALTHAYYMGVVQGIQRMGAAAQVILDREAAGIRLGALDG